MDPLTLAAIGAALGAAKGEFIDKPREQRQREVAATTQRFSPWTGMSAGPIKEADTFGNVLQGGMTGASLGQGLESQAAYKDALAKQAGTGSIMAAGGNGAYNLGVQYPQGYQPAPQIGQSSPWNLLGR